MDGADPCSEKEPEDAGQGRVADISVLPRHCAVFDFTAEAVAHAEIRAVHQTFNHGHGFNEVIRAIAVAHDKVRGIGCGETADQGCTVAALGDIADAGTGLFGNALTAVTAAIVGDDDFAFQLLPLEQDLQRLLRALNARQDCRGLIQTRHHDCD